MERWNIYVKKMKKYNKGITEWVEWRYPTVWKDFKLYITGHSLYNPQKGIHHQDSDTVFKMVQGYFQRFNVKCGSLWLDKEMKRAFSHINIKLR